MAEEQKQVVNKENEDKAQEQQNAANSFWFKAKNAFNRAQFSRYIGFIGVVIATVVISLYQVGWDPTKIGWNVFVANTALLLFLGIYGLFFGEGEGGSFFKRIITGAYQVARSLFLDIVDAIKKKNYTDALPDYIVWRYQKDYDNTCKMKMLSVRLFDMSILDLPDEKIEELRTKHIKIDENTYYSKISDAQYKVIRQIKSGEIFVDYIDDYSFFLNDENTDGEQQATRVKNTPKRKEKITWKQRISRVVMIFLVALIFAGFFKEAYGSGAESAAEQAAAQQQAIRTLLTRISTLVVSIAAGINTARLLNLEDVFVLKYKKSYDEVFFTCMENKTFIPVDYKAKAKADYEEQVRKEEEAIKNVITPEVIDKEPIPQISYEESNTELVKGEDDHGSRDEQDKVD